MRWLLVAVVLLTACSGGTRELGITDEATGSIDPPESTLATEDELWVEFEARWLCDLERSTYADPADVEVALEDRLVEEGIDEADYEQFKARLADDPDLAAHVQAATLERCGD